MPILARVTDPVEGQIIPVMVGDQPYETVIINGVQRFIEDKNNPLYRRLQRDTVGVVNPAGDIVDLNDMAIRYHRGEFSQREYAEFNMALGYSVGGFCDLSSFEDMDIDNPLWEAPTEYAPDHIIECSFTISPGAMIALDMVFEEGIDALDHAAHGSKKDREEARAIVEMIRENARGL